MWLALTLSGHVHHAAAAAWLDTIDEPGSVHFCRATQQTLLRLLTNAAVLAPYGNAALSNDEAWGVYDSFLDDGRVSLLRTEPRQIDITWRRLSGRSSASPKLWMDAYLAAFASAAGLTLATTDTAYSQFDGLNLLILGTG